MHADEDILLPFHVALDQGKVVLAVGVGSVEMQVKIPVSGGKLDDLDALDQFLARAPVMDQIFDGADFQFVAAGKTLQLPQSRHRTVFAHDLADDAHGAEARELDQVHCGLGVSGALQNPARLGAQGKHMPRLRQVFGNRSRASHGLNGQRSVGGTDAGGDAPGGIDAHLKIGAKILRVLHHHLFDAQLFESLQSGWYANQTPAILGHKIDGGRSNALGGHDQITLIFPIGIIHHNDHPALAEIGHDRFNRVKLAFHG